ncbi:hypothetical protein AXG93_2109s1000 [Marchantia polymorpha subsp. ruderalis]|uniref:Uncharacterized protein n=1 Tax=Marchantia polymorpha subsp. ruderalis TaxID=1480154 RepID=A0A176WFX1_MARPO|nr:hypothetical protein AXG93_2109s1000 [Marchantia polymorpha subsp. ruderalis]
MALKFNFLLWGWNWVCLAMVREWLGEKDQPPRGYRPHPERWQVSDCEQVLGRCVGEEGDLLFDCGSVQVTKEEEISFDALFKNSKSSKNGYKTPTERVQFPLLSRTNPGKYVKDVEVDTDSDEAPASTPPARPRADDEPRGARALRKWKWDGEEDQSQWAVPTAPVRRRANNEPASQPKQKAHKLFLPASSADTWQAAVTRDSPSSEEDVSAKVLERSADLPTPKARVPSEEARRPSGHRRRHAATTNMPAMEKCLPSKQVPFDDSPSGQEPSAQEPSVQAPSAQE